MGDAVRADRPRPIQAKRNVEVLQAYVVQDFIVRALQKGGIHRHHGAKSRCGKPRRKGCRVFFADSHVEKVVFKFLFKLRKSRTVLHAGGNGENAVVLFRKRGKRISERRGISVHAVFKILGNAVKALGLFFRALIALALDGMHVQ